MKRITLIIILSLALGVLSYMYFNLKKVGAVGPKFISQEDYERVLQSSMDVVYKDMDTIKDDVIRLEARVSEIESKLN